jgi:hypothetical protein
VDLAGWIGVAGVVVAIVAIVAGVGVAVWQNPSKSVEWDIEAVGLLRQRTDFGGAVMVLVNNQPVASPTSVTVWLRNSGRRAIRSSDFDQGKACVFDLGSSVLVGLDLPEDAYVDMIDGKIVILPRLLHPGEEVRASVLVDNTRTQLEGTFTSSLADVKITRDRPTDRQRHLLVVLVQHPMTLFVAGGAGMAIGLVATIFSGN